MEDRVKLETSIRPAEARHGPVKHWRIHLGAHKTATTHLQETLTLVRPMLADRGLDFIPNQLVRRQRLAVALWRRRPIARVPILGPARMREVIEGLVDPLRLGPETVVLSEENIVGLPDQIIAPAFYPRAATAVARLASLGQRAGLVFFLSIRSYDTLLPSAYAETLKHDPAPPGGFEAVRARLLAAPPSWFDLVGRLRAAAPEVPLHIWRQEDYRANAQAIMEAVCGMPLGVLPEISDPSWTRSPSAEAIAAAEALPAGLPRDERNRRVRELYNGIDGERFRPLTAAERSRLRAAYEADLDRIARAYPDVLMRFTPAELAA